MDTLPVGLSSGTVLASEIVNYRPMACLDAFFAGELGGRHLLMKVSRLELARKLAFSKRDGIRSRIFGVLAGYYTCHIPLNEPGAKAVFRFCLGLRQGGGTIDKIKFVIKCTLTELGFCWLLCDYYLVSIERTSHV